MSKNKLQYQKRNWSKLTGVIYEIKPINQTLFGLTLCKGKDLIRLVGFVESISSQVQKRNLGEKVVVWFKPTSKEWKADHWNTNLWLMHYESPKEKFQKKMQEEKINTNLNDKTELNFEAE